MKIYDIVEVDETTIVNDEDELTACLCACGLASGGGSGQSALTM